MSYSDRPSGFAGGRDLLAGLELVAGLLAGRPRVLPAAPGAAGLVAPPPLTQAG